MSIIKERIPVCELLAGLAEEAAELVGSNVEYAPYVELGTYKMNAKPYLRPAVEDHQSEYHDIVERIMKG